MFFRRRKPPLTSAAYDRWLRAQRPPLLDFLKLSEVEQEALALIGDEYMQDLAVAIGYAVRDPQAAGDGIGAARGDATAEESLVRQLAAGFAKAIAAKATAKPPKPEPWSPPKESFAGFGERKTTTVTDNARKRPKLFGQEPTA